MRYKVLHKKTGFISRTKVILLIIKRFFTFVVMLFVILFIVMMLIESLPGSIGEGLSSRGTGDGLDFFLCKMSLHDTLFGRYLRYISAVICKFDFGFVRPGIEMRQFILPRLLITATLAGVSLFLTSLIGIPAGILAATNRNRLLDNIISVLTFILYAIPPFVLAIAFILVFSLKLRLFSVIGDGSVKDYVLPVAVLSSNGVAIMTRAVRSATLDISEKQYIRAMKARGIPDRKILFDHVIRNALPSILSAIHSSAIQIICGTLIIEIFFQISGLGASVIDAIDTRNQPLLLACVFFLSSLIMMIGYVIDIIDILTDPRKKIRVLQ